MFEITLCNIWYWIHSWCFVWEQTPLWRLCNYCKITCKIELFWRWIVGRIQFLLACNWEDVTEIQRYLLQSNQNAEILGPHYWGILHWVSIFNKVGFDSLEYQSWYWSIREKLCKHLFKTAHKILQKKKQNKNLLE